MSTVKFTWYSAFFDTPRCSSLPPDPVARQVRRPRGASDLRRQQDEDGDGDGRGEVGRGVHGCFLPSGRHRPSSSSGTPTWRVHPRHVCFGLSLCQIHVVLCWNFELFGIEIFRLSVASFAPVLSCREKPNPKSESESFCFV